MWMLVLNPMRAANIEARAILGWADTKEQIEQYLEAHKVEPYSDGEYTKFYRQGSPLEWFKPPVVLLPGDQAIVEVPETVDVNGFIFSNPKPADYLPHLLVNSTDAQPAQETKNGD